MTASKREKIRGTLLAALMVASVFAAAAPASAGVASGDRTVSSTTVAPGGSTTVTASVTMDGSGGSLSLNEFFSGEVSGAAVRDVTVDGSSVDPFLAEADATGAVVTLTGLAGNANVEVTYVVNATGSSGSITIEGNASGSGTTADLGTDTITVGSSGSSDSAITSADRTVDSSVNAGENATVTVSAELNASGGSLSLNEFFSGDVADATVEDVTVDGSSVDPFLANADTTGAVVTLTSLPGNANVEVTYTVTAASTSPGSITIEGNVSSSGTVDLGTDTISVTSADPANFDVSDKSAPSSVTKGDTASVSATVTNTGDLSDTQTIEFRVDGSVVDSTSLTLDGGESQSVSFTLDTSTRSPGTYTLGVFSDDDSETASITVDPMSTGATAPDAGSYSSGSYAGDRTNDSSLARGITSEIGDLAFGTSGNVDNVTVDPTAGSGSSGISADDIDSIEVILDTASGSVSSSQSYDGAALTYNFGNVSGVTGVQVLAAISGSINDSDSVDLGIELGVGSSLFTGSTGLYDTAGVQTAAVGDRPTFVSAEVRDRNGNPITEGNVTFRNVASGVIPDGGDNVPLNDRGETRRVEVAPGTYNVTVDAPGFETFSGRVTVALGETREIDVTLSPIDILDRVEVTPKTATAIADEESITYTVTTFDKDGDRLSGVRVNARDDNPDITFTSPTTNTTDDNGQATFTVTSPVIATGTLTFTAENDSGTPDRTATATATFIRSGEGAIDGQVFDTSTTSGLPNATVYAVLETRWSQNRFPTVVDLSSLSLTDDDNKVFVRLVDADSGEIIDNDEYDVRTRDESGTGVRQIEELNESNAAVGEGFALVDIDGDGEFNFSHTRLANEDYYAQVSLDASEASDERVADDSPEAFVNVSGYDATGEVTSVGGVVTDASDFDPSADLTVSATRDRAALSGANLVDTTDADGDFKLTKLFTEYQLGRDYVVVAEKTGYSTDIADVFVQEDGSTFEDRVKRAFNLSPEEVTPAEVNITQVGLHPVTSYDPALISEFPDKSDEVAQEVPRNGSVIDVVEIETLTENGDRINGTAEVAVEDASFDGSWVGVAGGTVVSTSPSISQITVNTGSDGVARLLLQPDSSSADLLTNKTAVLTNDRSATDNTTVEFVGQITFKKASISGLVTDTAGTPVSNTTAYVKSFVFPRNESVRGDVDRADQTRFEIFPEESGADGVDSVDDTFTIARQSWNGATLEWENETVVTGITRRTLADYSFPRSDFPSIDTDLEDATGFNLIDEATRTADASYTLDPLPAVDTSTGADSMSYNIKGVKLTEPNKSTSRFGLGTVQPGSTDDVNIVLPINLTEANYDVSSLSAPSSAGVGETINVSATVTNNGGTLNSDQNVDFRVDLDGDGALDAGETLATQTIDLLPGENQTVTFSVDTSALAPGNYTHGVFTEDDSETATIEILGSVSFEVSNLSAPASVPQGDSVTVNATVTNTGATSGTQTVEFRANGTVADSTSVTLGAGASQQVSFTLDTSGLAPGNYTHGVFSEDDNETATLRVLVPANFTINSVSSPANITQGDTLNVSALIENTGEATATKPVSLTINGTNVSTGAGTVDIVLAIDTSGSMSDEISAVQSGLTSFTNTLQSQGVDVRYAVITFADQVPYNVRQNYTSNVTQTQQTLNAISTGGAIEQSFDVINDSIDIFNERSSAQEYFLVFTDEDSDTDSGTPNASQVVTRLDAEDIRLFGITTPEPTLGVPELSVGFVANNSANGQYFNLAEGNFSAKFENEIAGAIANASSGQQLTLAGGETGTANFSIAGSTTSNLAVGNYTVEVDASDDSASASLQVQSACPLSPLVQSYDTNGDCAIDVTELGQAGSDYATGAISVTELGQVGSAYAST